MPSPRHRGFDNETITVEDLGGPRFVSGPGDVTIEQAQWTDAPT
jgi:hypothetical protein